MKNACTKLGMLGFGFVMVSVGSGFSSSAEAREKSHQKRSLQSEHISLTTHQAAPEHSDSSKTYGLGFSTMNASLRGTGSSLTATIDFSPKDTLQVLFALPSTNGFQMGAGALFKKTVAESENAGFHVGGGLGLGAISGSLSLGITGLAGFHFSLPGLSHVRVHLDGGPTFSFLSTTPSVTNFQISGLSAAMGLSVLYIL